MREKFKAGGSNHFKKHLPSLTEKIFLIISLPAPTQKLFWSLITA